jgi:hypothetical protein
MLGEGWMFQWWRVQHRIEQVRAVYNGRHCVGDRREALDTVLSFFEAIHHLQDWLSKDTSVSFSKDDGVAVVRASPMLQLCADLANGSKHVSLTRPWTQAGRKGITRNDATVHVGTGNVSYAFYVESDGEQFDVLQIAEIALIQWKSILTSKQLL